MPLISCIYFLQKVTRNSPLRTPPTCLALPEHVERREEDDSEVAVAAAFCRMRMFQSFIMLSLYNAYILLI